MKTIKFSELKKGQLFKFFEAGYYCEVINVSENGISWSIEGSNDTYLSGHKTLGYVFID